jgi:hypothetical protein
MEFPEQLAQPVQQVQLAAEQLEQAERLAVPAQLAQPVQQVQLAAGRLEQAERLAVLAQLAQPVQQVQLAAGRPELPVQAELLVQQDLQEDQLAQLDQVELLAVLAQPVQRAQQEVAQPAQPAQVELMVQPARLAAEQLEQQVLVQPVQWDLLVHLEQPVLAEVQLDQQALAENQVRLEQQALLELLDQLLLIMELLKNINLHNSKLKMPHLLQFQTGRLKQIIKLTLWQLMAYCNQLLGIILAMFQDQILQLRKLPLQHRLNIFHRQKLLLEK